MGSVSSHHTDLVGGLKIVARHPGTGQESGGTLTGLALKGTTKVLVTNSHVMAVLDPSEDYRDPTGDERMYQGGDQVGSQLWFEPFVVGTLPWQRRNKVDIAASRKLTIQGAKYLLHDATHSENRVVIQGTKSMAENDVVYLFGGYSGEQVGRVRRVATTATIRGARFDCMEIEFPNDIIKGDSGSPIAHKVRDGVYQMAAINFGRRNSNFRKCLAFRSDLAQDALGITFGKRATTMHVFASPAHANVGDTVFLNGSGSLDPDGGDLTFL